MLLNGFEMSHVLWNPFYSHTQASGVQRASPISQPFPRNQFPEIIFESPELRCESGTAFRVACPQQQHPARSTDPVSRSCGCRLVRLVRSTADAVPASTCHHRHMHASAGMRHITVSAPDARTSQREPVHGWLVVRVVRTASVRKRLFSAL